MKFSIAAIALAAVAVASPVEMEPRTNPSTCNINGNNNGKVVCCNSLIPILGQILCNIAVLGSTCNAGQTVRCCETDANGGLINISLLNCVG
ncbi:uncharacterized protein BBA_09070 [Beauveria bassiana ARSEF 2860]|uniref:Class I hydrophobin E n=1 Tax=Beauveria bassiana (strain ARSEF 2860) TaxID=655819 RepID=HYD1E_BEAB2|nr:uncharacterized protein BBA_09070 [Beauveria bassiana ARSEF 2860]EJP62022.1 hypothetical protein BBA_09070 [Beauveria bassiana ARSEF 2860]